MDLGEELRRMFLAGVGAVSMTGEKARELIDELVKRGEIDVAQGKVLNEELQHKIRAKVQAAVGCKPSAEHVAACMEQMTPEERAELRRKLDEMDRPAAETEKTDAEEAAAEEAAAEETDAE